MPFFACSFELKKYLYKETDNFSFVDSRIFIDTTKCQILPKMKLYLCSNLCCAWRKLVRVINVQMISFQSFLQKWTVVPEADWWIALFLLQRSPRVWAGLTLCSEGHSQWTEIMSVFRFVVSNDQLKSSFSKRELDVTKNFTEYESYLRLNDLVLKLWHKSFLRKIFVDFMKIFSDQDFSIAPYSCFLKENLDSLGGQNDQNFLHFSGVSKRGDYWSNGIVKV